MRETRTGWAAPLHCSLPVCYYHHLAIRRAITYVEQLEAAGETNINGALLMAMDILAEEKINGTLKVSLENLKSSSMIERNSLTRKLMSHFLSAGLAKKIGKPH